MRWCIKLLLGGAFFLLCVVLGCLESSRLSLRVRRLEELIHFFQLLETEIEFAALPISEIIRRHHEDTELLLLCDRELSSGAAFSEAWQYASEKCSGLLAEDRRYLLSFGASFGGMDRTGQVGSCRMTSGCLTHQLELAREASTRKGRLYRSLGALCGAGILLLIV